MIHAPHRVAVAVGVVTSRVRMVTMQQPDAQDMDVVTAAAIQKGVIIRVVGVPAGPLIVGAAAVVVAVQGNPIVSMGVISLRIMGTIYMQKNTSSRRKVSRY